MSTPEARYVEDRRKKQVFLTREIIDKGYDPDAFTEYCELLKSSDIDMWALQDLMDCVETFKLRNSPMEHPAELHQQSDSPEPMEIPKVVRVQSLVLPPVNVPPAEPVSEPASEPTLDTVKPEETPVSEELPPPGYPHLSMETGMEEIKVSAQDGRPVYTIPGRLISDNPISKTANVRVTVEK